MSAEPSLPPITDPNLAMLYARLGDMHADLNAHRDEARTAIAAVGNRIDGVEKRIEPIEKVMTKAQGGYLVLVGLGSLVALTLTFWERILKLLGKT